jgi:hypothetical protein
MGSVGSSYRIKNKIKCYNVGNANNKQDTCKNMPNISSTYVFGGNQKETILGHRLKCRSDKISLAQTYIKSIDL